MASRKTTQELFNNAIAFKDDKDKLSFEAEMIHLDIMYEVECLMEKECMKKIDLSKKMKVSKGYLTQLFTGDKLLNLKSIAKLQRIFGVQFSVTMKPQMKEQDIGDIKENFENDKSNYSCKTEDQYFDDKGTNFERTKIKNSKNSNEILQRIA